MLPVAAETDPVEGRAQERVDRGGTAQEETGGNGRVPGNVLLDAGSAFEEHRHAVRPQPPGAAQVARLAGPDGDAFVAVAVGDRQASGGTDLGLVPPASSLAVGETDEDGAERGGAGQDRLGRGEHPGGRGRHRGSGQGQTGTAHDGQETGVDISNGATGTEEGGEYGGVKQETKYNDHQSEIREGPEETFGTTGAWEDVGTWTKCHAQNRHLKNDYFALII